jgi:hypothetical protein
MSREQQRSRYALLIFELIDGYIEGTGGSADEAEGKEVVVGIIRRGIEMYEEAVARPRLVPSKN